MLRVVSDLPEKLRIGASASSLRVIVAVIRVVNVLPKALYVSIKASAIRHQIAAKGGWSHLCLAAMGDRFGKYRSTISVHRFPYVCTASFRIASSRRDHRVRLILGFTDSRHRREHSCEPSELAQTARQVGSLRSGCRVTTSWETKFHLNTPMVNSQLIRMKPKSGLTGIHAARQPPVIAHPRPHPKGLCSATD